jgi:hypothetical protein
LVFGRLRKFDPINRRFHQGLLFLTLGFLARIRHKTHLAPGLNQH